VWASMKERLGQALQERQKKEKTRATCGHMRAAWRISEKAFGPGLGLDDATEMSFDSTEQSGPRKREGERR